MDDPLLLIAVGLTSALGSILCMKLYHHHTNTRSITKTGRKKWRLYHGHTFSSARCLWLIEEMKVSDDFEIIQYNPYTASKQEVDKYKEEVNIDNTVPSLVTDDGHVMTDSTGICLYLANLYGKILPDPAYEPVYYDLSLIAATKADACLRVVFQNLYRYPEERRDLKAVESNIYTCLEWIQKCEDHLVTSGGKYMCGNKFTVADIIIGYCIVWVDLIKGGMLLRDSPEVKRYLATLKKRSLYEKCMGTSRDWMTADEREEED